MTVIYSYEVARSGFGKFVKLLFRWKGSVYQLIWKEFVTFVIIYYILAAVHHFALHGHGKVIFEAICSYLAFAEEFPVVIILGFYTSLCLHWWMHQFHTIPWPDQLSILISTNVVGTSDKARMIRRTIARYAVTALVITLSTISPVVKRRFPKFRQLADAGLLLPNELKELKEVATPHHKFFVPIIWACNLLFSAKEEGFIKSDGELKSIFDELNAFRTKLSEFLCYNRISIPLAYTQVVTVITYSYFILELMGQQFITDDEKNLVVPIFIFLKFIFYMGWLKVAESVANPFGDGNNDNLEDDFEINKLINRNMQMSYLIVDGMYKKHPEVQRDIYWNVEEFEVPNSAPLQTGCTALSCCNEYTADFFREEHGLWKEMYLNPEVLQKMRSVRRRLSTSSYYRQEASSSSGAKGHCSIADVQLQDKPSQGPCKSFRRMAGIGDKQIVVVHNERIGITEAGDINQAKPASVEKSQDLPDKQHEEKEIAMLKSSKSADNLQLKSTGGTEEKTPVQ